MKTALIALCSTLLATAVIANDRNKDRDDADDSKGTFATLDTNSDGQLSEAEVSGSALSSNFSEIDGNSDGYISRGEFRRNTMPKPRRD